MGHIEQIEARLHDAQATHYSERTPAQERMAQNEQERREAEREEKVADLTRDIMRDPDQEALEFIADCNSHLYPELWALCSAIYRATGEHTRMKAMAEIFAFMRPQAETCASYRLLER